MIVPLEKSSLEDLVVKHVSERPWSDYTEADYTLAQWHNACLIHQHQGPPTSKSQCKLPVKTPNGALNRNGVHAAAAALAGARSELKATPEEKAKARVALRRYYSQLDETPPDSLAQSAIDHILERHGGDVVTPFDLEHVGVKGMHWGIRKKEETSNRKPAKTPGPVRQKLIKYHTSQAKAQQARIDYVNKHPSKWKYIQNQNIKEVKQREKIRDQHLKDIKNLQEGKLTDFQKKALIGAGVAATVLAVYGVSRYRDTKARQFVQTGDKIIGIPFKRNDALSRKMTSKQIMEEVIPQINPGRGSGRRNNCLRCSFAYELRRRGYDVEATSTAKGGFEQTAVGVARALSGAKARSVSGRLGEHDIQIFQSHQEIHNLMIKNSPGMARQVATRIFDGLPKEEGARGELGISWGTLQGAHSIAWEIIGGKPHIFDTQVGKHFSSPEEFVEYAKHISEAAYTRLDDIDLDEGFLMREWIQNVK
jgi:hypothetical protein